jgi:hypothetical protein
MEVKKGKLLLSEGDEKGEALYFGSGRLLPGIHGMSRNDYYKKWIRLQVEKWSPARFEGRTNGRGD